MLLQYFIAGVREKREGWFVPDVDIRTMEALFSSSWTIEEVAKQVLNYCE